MPVFIGPDANWLHSRQERAAGRRGNEIAASRLILGKSVPAAEQRVIRLDRRRGDLHGWREPAVAQRQFAQLSELDFGKKGLGTVARLVSLRTHFLLQQFRDFANVA